MAKPETVAVFLKRDEAQQIVLALDVHAAMTWNEEYGRLAKTVATKVREAATLQGWNIEAEEYDA